jgi:hypothetical protein
MGTFLMSFQGDTIKEFQQRDNLGGEPVFPRVVDRVQGMFPTSTRLEWNWQGGTGDVVL